MGKLQCPLKEMIVSTVNPGNEEKKPGERRLHDGGEEKMFVFFSGAGGLFGLSALEGYGHLGGEWVWG